MYPLILLIHVGGADLSTYTASMGFVLLVTDLYHNKWEIEIEDSVTRGIARLLTNHCKCIPTASHT